MSEIHDLMSQWSSRTRDILEGNLVRMNIGISNKLSQSLREETTTSGDMVKSSLSMLARGRFRDMGAGSGSRANSKKRKPKKWYSRAYYGRLSSLYGAIGYKMSQDTMSALRNIK
jgi:hypothetical protein